MCKQSRMQSSAVLQRNNCSLLYDKKDYFNAPQEKQIKIVSVTSDENYEVLLKGNIYFLNILFEYPV